MMSEEKQIEEMAEDLETAKVNALATIGSMNDGFGAWYAKALYNAGYRRQSGATDTNVGLKSEWISVEERLPGVTGNYICCVKDRNGNLWTIPVCWSLEMKTWFGKLGEIKNSVTHWMPLPEPPKP